MDVFKICCIGHVYLYYIQIKYRNLKAPLKRLVSIIQNPSTAWSQGIQTGFFFTVACAESYALSLFLFKKFCHTYSQVGRYSLSKQSSGSYLLPLVVHRNTFCRKLETWALFILMFQLVLFFRFADKNSFEYEYGMRWKRLYEMYKEKKLLLESDLIAEMEQLERRLAIARHDHETEMLRRGEYIMFCMFCSISELVLLVGNEVSLIFLKTGGTLGKAGKKK